jgi:hypothetical protein
MYTFDEYSWMTHLDSKNEHHNVMTPISSDEEIRDLKLRLILLRKYTSPEKKGEPVYAEKLMNAITSVFPDLKEETNDIISEIHGVENNTLSSSLSNGDILSLRETIELELYGIHLHSDIDKIERLTASDPQLRYIAIREYVESYEIILQKAYRLLKKAGVDPLPIKNEDKASILRVTKTDGIKQGIKKSQYWSNIFGRDASNEELHENFMSQDEESFYILVLTTLLIECLEQDDLDTEVLKSMIHPAVISDWGNFREVSKYIRSLNDIGLSGTIRYNDRHDMAYVYFLENVVDGFIIQDFQIISNAHTVTLVKDNNDEWKVYSIGDKLDDYLITVRPFEYLKKLIKRLRSKKLG